MKLDPADMAVDAAKFEKHFSVSWDAVLKSKRAFNARNACRALKMHPPELDAAWKVAFADKRVLKLGGGFYVGAIPIPDRPDKFVYVFNAFYLSMRGVYTAADAAIRYFVVEWSPDNLSWSKFRGEVVGATNPAKAVPGSLRAAILSDWESLGLEGEPFPPERNPMLCGTATMGHREQDCLQRLARY